MIQIFRVAAEKKTERGELERWYLSSRGGAHVGPLLCIPRALRGWRSCRDRGLCHRYQVY